MNTVHISLNELENVSYKALESLKYDEGFCEALSKDLTFLEAVGLQGVWRFAAFLLSCQDIGHPETQLAITKHSDDAIATYLCDCRNISCIHFMQPLVEYVVSRLTMNPQLKVLFRNSYDYVFLLPYLQKFSPVPLSIQWHDKRKNKYNIGFMSPKSEYPEFFSSITKNVEKEMCATLTSYASVEDALSTKHAYASMCPHAETQTCAQRFEQSLVGGLFVSQEQWRVIQSFEKGVLVPSNDMSRSGAGETAHVVDSEDLLFKKNIKLGGK